MRIVMVGIAYQNQNKCFYIYLSVCHNWTSNVLLQTGC